MLKPWDLSDDCDLTGSVVWDYCVGQLNGLHFVACWPNGLWRMGCPNLELYCGGVYAY